MFRKKQAAYTEEYNRKSIVNYIIAQGIIVRIYLKGLQRLYKNEECTSIVQTSFALVFEGLI